MEPKEMPVPTHRIILFSHSCLPPSSAPESFGNNLTLTPGHVNLWGEGVLLE
jgi:hypothetical protein